MQRDDRGAALADFVMVSTLVVLLFVIVFQVGLALHTRNVLVSLAAEGARYGADADVDSTTLVADRTRSGITNAFNATYAGRSQIEVDLAPTRVTVTVRAPLPLPFLVGSPIVLTARGHALEERRP